MQAEQLLRFGSYRFDLRTTQLWRGTLEVKLTPKALAVLRVLVTRTGQVVMKDEFFRNVWTETVVSDDALAACIQELRQALRDDARRPRYIETLHRRGYRFIGKVVSSQWEEVKTNIQHPTPHLVGREAELQQLYGWLEKALSGARQLVFVTGEPGIGKTTLVEAFLTRIADEHEHELWIGRGQCIEHYGAGEAYLPILEALGRLCREPEGRHLIALLSQHAPTWLVQMPALLTTPELKMLQRKTQGATRERMLRELAEAVEAVTVKKPLVLWLEDLHWCDVSTLDWLAYVARRREPARLLVIGTYRPVDVLVREHPLRALKQELQMHGYCTELLLDFLGEEDVAKYLAKRFSVGAIHELPLLARLIHQRTDGNPLFMVNVVDSLVTRGVLVQSDGRWELQERVEKVAGGVPESLQQMIEQQIERLRPETQRLLEVASVAGAEFSAAAVAAGMETEIDGIEDHCEALVRQEHFLRASGTAEWPDGTVAARYGFRHALYQDVLYHRLTARRRQRLHQRIGEREEQAYGDRAREIAAELAVHFERGRDYRRAIRYLQHAGENALRRSANQEAITLLTKGLALLKTLPDTPERAQQELTLQVTLGAPLTATKGYAAPEVERSYTRARELCQKVGEIPQLYRVLGGLYAFHFFRAEFQTARALAEQRLTLAESVQDPVLLEAAHNSMGIVLYRLGELVSAREHLEQSLALYNSKTHHFQAFLSTTDIYLGIGCLSNIALVLWTLGYPDQALRRSHEALARARELSHAHSLAYALDSAAMLHQLRREGQAGQEQAEALIAFCGEHGFPFWLSMGTLRRGWALVEQEQGEEGIVQIQQGMATYRATGAEALRPNQLATLAWAYGKMGQAEEGLAVLTEALATVNKTGERSYEAELYRLKGELLLAQQSSRLQAIGHRGKTEETEEGLRLQAIDYRERTKEAEVCFLKAIKIARKQQAKSLELRATVSLARLWQQQGKKAKARQMLAEIYGWFTEGFDTADLQEAQTLLAELDGPAEMPFNGKCHG